MKNEVKQIITATAAAPSPFAASRVQTMAPAPKNAPCGKPAINLATRRLKNPGESAANAFAPAITPARISRIVRNGSFLKETVFYIHLTSFLPALFNH